MFKRPTEGAALEAGTTLERVRIETVLGEEPLRGFSQILGRLRAQDPAHRSSTASANGYLLRLVANPSAIP